MAKCMECGGPVGVDGCPRCRPLDCSCCDPTAPSPDPVVVRLEAEVERLSGDYAKLYGVVREYIACEKHPQMRGEAYRDLRSTYDLLSGADADQGGLRAISEY